MRRHRAIAASPQRTAAETWQTVCSLIGDTLDRSSSIDRTSVEESLQPLGQLGRMLISAGHLEKNPLVLVAGDLWVEITTVSGGSALVLDENLNPVPGGATATDWTLHIPQVEPMAKLVRATVKSQDHLSCDEPVEQSSATAKTNAGVDLAALARWAREDA